MTKIADYANSSLLFAAGSAPATPAEGNVRVYAKPDGAMYSKNAAGTETPLGGTGVAGRNTVTTINVTTAGALTLDYSLGDYFIVNLGANVTSMTISNPPSGGGSIRVRFVQDATGNRTVTLPSNAKAITGTDTAVQAAASAQSVLHLTTDNGGTSWGYSMKGIAV